jgi:hypothetical protein
MKRPIPTAAIVFGLLALVPAFSAATDATLWLDIDAPTPALSHGESESWSALRATFAVIAFSTAG